MWALGWVMNVPYFWLSVLSQYTDNYRFLITHLKSAMTFSFHEIARDADSHFDMYPKIESWCTKQTLFKAAYLVTKGCFDAMLWRSHTQRQNVRMCWCNAPRGTARAECVFTKRIGHTRGALLARHSPDSSWVRIFWYSALLLVGCLVMPVHQ